MGRRIAWITAGLALGMTAGQTWADKRPYVWTYGGSIGHVGAIELEHYATYSAAALGDLAGTTAVTHQLEVETGLAKGWDVAVYQVFKQGAGSSTLAFSETKLRTRFALAPRESLGFDLLGYAEYAFGDDFGKHKLEGKLIAAWDFAPGWNAAANAVYEIVFGAGRFPEHEYKYALGVAYQLADTLGVALESKGEWVIDTGAPAGARLKSAHFVGPTVVIGGNKIRWTVGAAFQVGGPAMDLRMILGFYL